MSTSVKIGTGCLVVGSIALYTIWASNISDYMHLEDLSLEYSPAADALASVSPGERLLLNGALALVIVGLILVLVAGVRKLRSNRRQ